MLTLTLRPHGRLGLFDAYLGADLASVKRFCQRTHARVETLLTKRCEASGTATMLMPTPPRGGTGQMVDFTS
jgi:hypothetical protein